MDVERVVAELAELQDPFLYWGFFDGRAPVQTRGKWADSSYKLCDRSVLILQYLSLHNRAAHKLSAKFS